jgi:hypothetical protein
MKTKNLSIFLFLCLIISVEVLALNKASIAKYPYQLLTNDYGILDENDLGLYAWQMKKSEPFAGAVTGGNYWQCFKSKDVWIGYEKSHYSEEDKADVYSFNINVKSNDDKIQRYWRARLIPKDFCEEIESQWNKLLKNQKYVCLGGSFILRENEIKKDKKIQIVVWKFDKIKTKNGCDSYFTTRGRSYCGMRHEEYNKEFL